MEYHQNKKLVLSEIETLLGCYCKGPFKYTIMGHLDVQLIHRQTARYRKFCGLSFKLSLNLSV